MGNYKQWLYKLPLCETMFMAYPDIPMAELIVARDQQDAIGTRNMTGRSLDFAYELENHQTSLRR